VQLDTMSRSRRWRWHCDGKRCRDLRLSVNRWQLQRQVALCIARLPARQRFVMEQAVRPLPDLSLVRPGGH
jgi:hypothetical protein